MKIGNINIIYGLASRSKPYGISKSLSSDSLNLSLIEKLGIKEFDGAESYPWVKEDINFVNNNKEIKFYTKIDFVSNPNLDNHLKVFSKSITEKRLKTVMYHSKLKDDKDIELFKNFCEKIKNYNLIPGISLYSEKEVILLAERKILPQFVQLPLNPSTEITANLKEFKDTNFIARSIFLQSAYFHPDKISYKLNSILKIHISIVKEIGKIYNYSLQDSLILYSLSKAISLDFSGLILSSTSINRLKIQLKIASQNFDENFFKFIDNKISKYSRKLSDPREW